MKRNFLTITTIVTLTILPVLLFNCQESENDSIEKQRQQHLNYLENSPYKETQSLSREERKAQGLPPNAYYEQLWELEMDPATGRPMPERAMQVQEQLNEQRLFARGVGGDDSNVWVDRGPNDQGGRTRGIMFDPNDVGNANPNDDYNRVFAGGVSGGLWVNEDITDPNQSWTLVPGIGANISVTVIVSDPNDSNTFYIGSGESYTSGQAVGRGIWKSTDGGVTWNNIFGGYTGFSGGNVDGIFYVNDVVVRDNNGVSEVYAAIASSSYRSSALPTNFLGLDEMGLYKSVDGGANWTRFNITHADGSFKNPNDIELDVNNNIWFTTTRNPFGNNGGDIYRSTDGNSFSLIRSFGASRRTELEPHPTNPNLFFVVCNINNQADIFFTTDAFATGANISVVNEPNDVDNGIPATDYTRGQAFYNLPIEMDPTGKLYVGGIDLFSSTDLGFNWDQISKWSNNNNLAALQVPRVHADQHAIVFRPGTNGTEAVFGNDGGVYYAPDMNNVVGNPNAIEPRNKDYNTIQFYYGSIDTAAATTNLAGGTQDNGTQFVDDAAPGANAYFDPVGGDGGFTEFAADGSYVITTYPGNSHVYLDYPSFTNGAFITNQGGGSFINEATLDKNLDILYVNASSQGNGISIERVKEFRPGGAPRENDLINSGLFNATPSAMKVSPYTTTSSTLFVGLRSGRLLRGNFADIATPAFVNISGPGFLGSISDIEFGQNEQEIFVTMHNYGVQSIWFTDDGGANWRSLEGNLPDIPVKAILQNPLIPEELIIGTELGVWATADYTQTSPTWVQAYNGMSDVTVLDLDLKASDNTILATTHGRGFFTSQFTSSPLSVLENEFETNDILVFPTITEGEINIKSQKELGDANINIYNVNGQRVFNTTAFLSDRNTNLNLNLNSGIYFVDIRVDNYSETKKIIIK